jgi:hypothetical protein
VKGLNTRVLLWIIAALILAIWIVCNSSIIETLGPPSTDGVGPLAKKVDPDGAAPQFRWIQSFDFSRYFSPLSAAFPRFLR